jgi:hypothetical protein
MIKFHLKCDQDHAFESWFHSGEAYDKLAASGLVSCAACGSTKIPKSMMAPAVSTSTTVSPPKPTEAMLAELRRKVESSSEYVGSKFAREARAMHDGLVPERPIYGEAKPHEAKKLIEDGIPVLPLPFMPTKKTN